jgi:hypothetical protein
MKPINASGVNFALPLNQTLPEDGPKAIPLLLDFTGSENTYVLDLLLPIQTGRISMVQCIYVDLAANSNDLIITMDGTNQRIKAKGNTQGYYPVLAPNPAKLTFVGVANTVPVSVFLLNFPLSGVVWSAA